MRGYLSGRDYIAVLVTGDKSLQSLDLYGFESFFQNHQNHPSFILKVEVLCMKNTEETHRKEKVPDTEISEDCDELIDISTIEGFNESGEKEVLTLIDTVVFENNRYYMLLPYYETEEEFELANPLNVFIMKKVWDISKSIFSDESYLEDVEDEVLLHKLCEIFKNSASKAARDIAEALLAKSSKHESG